MEPDHNEKKLVAKLVEVLELLDASQQDIQTIQHAKKVDNDFLKAAGEIFHRTEACDVCRHAFYSWRNTLDDETVFNFIDDWINWKKRNSSSDTKARVVKMKRR